MGQFIRKFIITTFLVSLISVLLSMLIYATHNDVYWNYEDRLLASKYDYYIEHQGDFNTLFCGSSKFYRQIDPVEFDSLNGGSTSSFNFAVGAFFPNRSIDFIEKFLVKSDGIRTIFIELAVPAKISTNYNTNPNINSIDHERYADIISLCRSTSFSQYKRFGYFIGYSVSYMYKYLGFGIRKYILASVMPGQNDLEPLNAEIAIRRGFYPLNEEIKNSTSKKWITVHEEFMSQHELILAGSVRENSPDTLKNQYRMDRITLRIKNLADKLTAKGKRVIFVITPRQRISNRQYLLFQKDALSMYTTIDLTDPTKYPMFYTLKNSFDRGHLNSLGARALTTAIAEQYNQ